MKIFNSVLFSLIFVVTVHGQFVGHKMSDEERLMMPDYIENVQNRSMTDPPTEPIRAMAEWEEVGKVQVSWKYYGQTAIKNILIQIIDEVKDVAEIVIICDDESIVQNELTNASVDWSQNVTFVTTGANSIWSRDYGANACYLNDVDSLVLVDWIYNRPRPLDDQVPAALSSFYNIPFYETNTVPNDLVNTGGNFMTDGMGMAFCEELILDENGPNNDWGTSNHSEEAIDDIMMNYMGIDRYEKLDVLPHDEIHHIDMHMKFLDEERIIVGDFPEGVSDGPTIESNIEYIQNNIPTSFGDQFEIIKIPMPPTNGQYHYNWNNVPYRTYTNALFVNSKILVPAYEEAYDTTAYRIWSEAKPGFDIVMIECNSIINYLGAIHCITKEMGVEDPLLINVDQHDDVFESMPAGYNIKARIKHQSGIQSTTLYYKFEDGDYTSINMTSDASCDDCYSAVIPEMTTGTVKYYVSAEANSGKVQVFPIVAPGGHLDFDIDIISSAHEVASAHFNIYPNPVSDILYVEGETIVESYSIVDVNGKVIQSKFDLNSVNLSVDLTIVAHGVYFIEIKTANEVYIEKIVK